MKKSIEIALVFLQVLFNQATLTELKDSKIINGREVRPEFAYPYQAYFLAGPFKCGATVIGRRHLITAAHCIKGERPTSRTYVILGTHRVSTQDAYGLNAENIFGSNIIRVNKFIRFRDRNADIGMLELERDIQFSSRIAPACIPARGAQNFAGMDGVITGWGGTVGYSMGQYVKQVGSDVLMETTVRVLAPNSKLCRKTFANKPNKLCAYRQGHDTCQGDSGGPMTIKQNGKFVLIGVTSSGRGCGATGHAGVYMRVSFFHDWIVDNVRDVCTSQPGTPVTARPVAGRLVTPRPITTKPVTIRPITARPATSGLGCSCSGFINRNGFGRCGKRDWDFGGRASCYVNLPSSCTDLVKSYSNPNKYLSANACKTGFIAEPAEPVVISTQKPAEPVVITTPKPLAGCSCSNFVNRNGFGRCMKKDSDFGWKVSCYVNRPSSCGDLIRSNSNPGKYLSAEACQTSPSSHFKEMEYNGN